MNEQRKCVTESLWIQYSYGTVNSKFNFKANYGYQPKQQQARATFRTTQSHIEHIYSDWRRIVFCFYFTFVVLKIKLQVLKSSMSLIYSFTRQRQPAKVSVNFLLPYGFSSLSPQMCTHGDAEINGIPYKLRKRLRKKAYVIYERASNRTWINCHMNKRKKWKKEQKQ